MALRITGYGPSTGLKDLPYQPAAASNAHRKAGIPCASMHTPVMVYVEIIKQNAIILMADASIPGKASIMRDTAIVHFIPHGILTTNLKTSKESEC